jgi:hypothetical protein
LLIAKKNRKLTAENKSGAARKLPLLFFHALCGEK